MSKKHKKLWVQHVMQTSFALALPDRIFTKTPRQIALGLKQAAIASKRRKARTPFQSAMSMLNFYINRAGKKLSEKDKLRLEKAKIELRKIFGRV